MASCMWKSCNGGSDFFCPPPNKLEIPEIIDPIPRPPRSELPDSNEEAASVAVFFASPPQSRAELCAGVKAFKLDGFPNVSPDEGLKPFRILFCCVPEKTLLLSFAKLLLKPVVFFLLLTLLSLGFADVLNFFVPLVLENRYGFHYPRLQ